MTDLPIIKTLDNGLRVVYVPFKGADSVTFRLLGRAGSIWEQKKELGIAHYLEHILLKGTKKYPTPYKLKNLIENVGGSYNGITGNFAVNFQVKLLKGDIEKGFDFLSQLVLHPLIKTSYIEKERTIISQEYTNKLDDPVINFILNSQKHIFPKKHRLSYPVIGTYETINSITRKQLLSFYKNNYTASNFVLSICSDGVEDLIYDLSNKYFGSMKKGNKNEYIGYRRNKNLVVYTEQNEKIQQATLSLVFPAPKRYEKKYYFTRYLNTILGGGATSRLFRVIRQKHGLAYSVGSSSKGFIRYGLFDIYAQTDPINTIKVLNLIKKEINKIVEKGTTNQEFIRTQKTIAANFVFNNERPETRTYSEGSSVLEDHEEENYYTQLEKFNSVTKNEVDKMAQEIFSQNPKIRILSNKVTQEEVLNAWQS